MSVSPLMSPCHKCIQIVCGRNPSQAASLGRPEKLCTVGSLFVKFADRLHRQLWLYVQTICIPFLKKKEQQQGVVLECCRHTTSLT